MTDQSKPCLPGCRSLQYNHGADYLHLPSCPNAPKPPEAPKAEELCATCQKQESFHHGSMHGFRKPAPAEAPKACPRCGVPFSRRGIYHSEGGCYETGIRKSTPAPASVTPASDAEVAAYQKEYDGYKSVTLTSASQIMRLIARIEQEKAANAELRAEAIENAHSYANSVAAHGRKDGQMRTLRARLAEVSKAAMAVVSNSDMATPPTIAAMAALEAILAKGDGK